MRESVIFIFIDVLALAAFYAILRCASSFMGVGEIDSVAVSLMVISYLMIPKKR